MGSKKKKPGEQGSLPAREIIQIAISAADKLNSNPFYSFDRAHLLGVPVRVHDAVPVEALDKETGKIGPFMLKMDGVLFMHPETLVRLERAIADGPDSQL